MRQLAKKSKLLLFGLFFLLTASWAVAVTLPVRSSIRNDNLRLFVPSGTSIVAKAITTEGTSSFSQVFRLENTIGGNFYDTAIYKDYLFASVYNSSTLAGEICIWKIFPDRSSDLSQRSPDYRFSLPSGTSPRNIALAELNNDLYLYVTNAVGNGQVYQYKFINKTLSSSPTLNNTFITKEPLFGVAVATISNRHYVFCGGLEDQYGSLEVIDVTSRTVRTVDSNLIKASYLAVSSDQKLLFVRVCEPVYGQVGSDVRAFSISDPAHIYEIMDMRIKLGGQSSVYLDPTTSTYNYFEGMTYANNALYISKYSKTDDLEKIYKFTQASSTTLSQELLGSWSPYCQTDSIVLGINEAKQTIWWTNSATGQCNLATTESNSPIIQTVSVNEVTGAPGMVWQKLKITGKKLGTSSNIASDFGNSRALYFGSHKVLYSEVNANSTAYTTAYGSDNTLLWTDTSIEVRVPSMAAQTYSSSVKIQKGSLPSNTTSFKILPPGALVSFEAHNDGTGNIVYTYTTPSYANAPGFLKPVIRYNVGSSTNYPTTPTSGSSIATVSTYYSTTESNFFKPTQTGTYWISAFSTDVYGNYNSTYHKFNVVVDKLLDGPTIDDFQNDYVKSPNGYTSITSTNATCTKAIQLETGSATNYVLKGQFIPQNNTSSAYWSATMESSKYEKGIMDFSKLTGHTDANKLRISYKGDGSANSYRLEAIRKNGGNTTYYASPYIALTPETTAWTSIEVPFTMLKATDGTGNTLDNYIAGYRITYQGSSDPAGKYHYFDNILAVDANTPDLTPPLITSFDPTNEATNISTTSITPITVTFTEEVVTSSLVYTFKNDQGENVPINNLAWTDNNKKVVIWPTAAFAAGRQYTLIITSAKDAAGNDTKLWAEETRRIKFKTLLGKIKGLGIRRNGDVAMTSTVTVSWEAVDGLVDIWILNTQGDYTTEVYTKPSNPYTWAKFSSNYDGSKATPPHSYTNSNSSYFRVGSGWHNYYKAMPAGTPPTYADLTAEVVGKFDIAVEDFSTNPNKFFISIPLQLINGNGLSAVFGNQCTVGDALLLFDADGNVTQGIQYNGADRWGGFSGVSTNITNIYPGMAYGYFSTQPAKYITLVGKLLETYNSVNIQGANGSTGFVANWISTAFPLSIDPTRSGLNVSTQAPNGTDFTKGGTIFLFDANANLIDFAVNTTSGWKKNDQIATLKLKPGIGYMFLEPQASFTWQQPKPY